MRSVLITGAAGRVGRVLAAAWADRYRLTLLDIVEPPRIHGAAVLIADVNDPDGLRSCLRGIHSVVHLAVVGNQEYSWDEILPTALTGTWSVLQAACEAGCERVVFASSVMIQLRPSSPYSAAKLWGETLGKCYTEHHDISILCLRLGAVRDPATLRLTTGDRRLAFTLTFPDMVQLFIRALEAPRELRYGVYPGFSDNGDRKFRIEETRRALGYEPRDNAYALAREGLLSLAGAKSLLTRGLRKAWRGLRGRD